MQAPVVEPSKLIVPAAQGFGPVVASPPQYVPGVGVHGSVQTPVTVLHIAPVPIPPLAAVDVGASAHCTSIMHFVQR